MYLKRSKCNLKKIKILSNDCININKRTKKNYNLIKNEISIGFATLCIGIVKG